MQETSVAEPENFRAVPVPKRKKNYGSGSGSGSLYINEKWWR